MHFIIGSSLNAFLLLQIKGESVGVPFYGSAYAKALAWLCYFSNAPRSDLKNWNELSLKVKLYIQTAYIFA